MLQLEVTEGSFASGAGVHLTDGGLSVSAVFGEPNKLQFVASFSVLLLQYNCICAWSYSGFLPVKGRFSACLRGQTRGFYGARLKLLAWFFCI